MRRTLTAALMAGLALTLMAAPAPAAAEPLFLAYRVHSQQVGWSEWKPEPRAAGTSHQSLRAEAIELRGTEATVAAHIQDIGWVPAVPVGQTAGTTGRAKRLEAIRVTSSIPGVGIECQAHVQDVGWTSWVADGQMCGTTGRGLRAEAFRLRLIAR